MTDDEPLLCAYCGRPIPPGDEVGGWSASGPGVWTHRDRVACGPPLPLPPLPTLPDGGRLEWPTDEELMDIVNER